MRLFSPAIKAELFTSSHHGLSFHATSRLFTFTGLPVPTISLLVQSKICQLLPALVRIISELTKESDNVAVTFIQYKSRSACICYHGFLIKLPVSHTKTSISHFHLRIYSPLTLLQASNTESTLSRRSKIPIRCACDSSVYVIAAMDLPTTEVRSGPIKADSPSTSGTALVPRSEKTRVVRQGEPVMLVSATGRAREIETGRGVDAET